MRFAFIACCLLLAACAAPQADRFNPYALNEQAVREAAAGRAASAQIMLERAALLAPHEPRIAANLAAVRAYREGRAPALKLDELRLPAAAQHPAPQSGEPAMPLWPAK